MKWILYVIIFIYMGYRAVYGGKVKMISSLLVDPINYSEFGNYLPPGTVKTIPCVYSNKLQQVEWIDPSGKVISQQKTNRIFTQKHSTPLSQGRSPSLLLTITDAWVEDSGLYECRSDGMTKDVALCIIDPLTFVDTPSEVNVEEGRSFTLTCEARGRPEPRLVWYRNEEVISDDCNSTKYKVMTKFNSQGFEGQLTITSIDKDDAGLYTCEAIQEHRDLEDCSISKKINITLNVNYAPVFADDDIVILFAKDNDSVDFVCEPRAYPAPAFRWFSEVDDGTLVNYPPDKVVTSEDETQTKITIVANVVSFGMKYVCRATNSLGYASKTFMIVETSKPKKPEEVIVYNSTDTQIYMNVTWDGEEVFPIDAIEIQLLIKEDKQKQPREMDWKKSKAVAISQENVANTNIPGVIVNELTPETDYWVRLRAVNELGHSPWSNVILAFTAVLMEEDSTTEETYVTDIDTPINADVIESRTDSMFYGIFFAGGILVISFLCMVVIRII